MAKKSGKHLVIVESPAKAKTINKYLGDGYIVKASMGHIRDLPSSGMGVDLKTFVPEYVLIKERGKDKVIAELKKLAKEAEDIYLATDLDREGEAIAWHLKEALGIPDDRVKRVRFNAITKVEIQKAFANPLPLDIDRVNAQQARRILDRVVGYEISPVLWRKVARGLSAGRVQSVAVRIIVDRELEIEAFQPEEYWSIGAVFTPDLQKASNLTGEWAEYKKPLEDGERTKAEKDKWLSEHNSFSADLAEVNGKKFEPESSDDTRKIAELLGFVVKDVRTVVDEEAKGRAKNQTVIVGAIGKGPAFTVKGVEKKRTTSRPPGPFITSTLQQAASTRLGFGAQRTMRAAQGLYEQGHITYMRTDSTHISGDALTMARSFIKSEFGDKYLPEKPNFFTSSNKDAQEAHEAIRPTDCTFTPRESEGKLKEDEAKLYRLIYNRFVACQMPPAEFDQTSINIGASAKGTEAIFRATGRKLVFDGYMKVAGISSDDQLLPDLATNQTVAPIDLSPEQHFTQPPARYTEASLVKELESKGIGRPSTYASIISTVQDRKYVSQLERKLHPTLLGRVVNEKLLQAFPQILDIGFTADMEAKLDKIEEQHLDWVQLLKDFYGPFHIEVEGSLEKLQHAGGMPSPYKDEATGTPLVYRISKNGFFLASGDPNVKITKPVDEFGKPMLREESPFKCPVCGRGMIRRKGRFGEFLSCTGYSEKNDKGEPSCSTIIPIGKSGEPDPPKAKPIITSILCEKDQGPMLLRWSKRGPFLGCSNFPKCRNTKMVGKLTEEQIAYIETLLPELRERTQKSYELAQKMTNKPLEAYGRLPELKVPRAAPAASKDDAKPKTIRRRKKAPVATE